MKTISQVKPRSAKKYALRNRTKEWPTKLLFDMRRVREEKNLTLREVAGYSGVSHATLARVENGATPDLPTALRLQTFYERPITAMWALTKGDQQP